VVTKDAISALNTDLWYDISDKCRSLNLSADPRIMIHDIEELNSKLSVGQYFYTDIKIAGIIIFDTKSCKLLDRKKLNDSERQNLVRDYFERWFGRAESAFKIYDFCPKEDDCKSDAFNLNQATEST
jgi:hypothetical protein